jgi:hypothetical protein
MLNNLQKYQTEFQQLLANIQQNEQNLYCVNEKIGNLKQIYSEFIAANVHNKIFLFCLESFNFQIKTFSADYVNMQNFLLLFAHRIICDYAKLYKIIVQFYDERKFAKPELKPLPVYNELKPLVSYNLCDIQILFDELCMLVKCLIDIHDANKIKIDDYIAKSQTGICITNFIQSLQCDNSLLSDQIRLYLNHIQFFKNNQIKYLIKLNHRIEMLKKDIDDEIKLEPAKKQVDDNASIVADLKTDELNVFEKNAFSNVNYNEVFVEAPIEVSFEVYEKVHEMVPLEVYEKVPEMVPLEVTEMVPLEVPEMVPIEANKETIAFTIENSSVKEPFKKKRALKKMYV